MADVAAVVAAAVAAVVAAAEACHREWWHPSSASPGGTWVAGKMHTQQGHNGREIEGEVALDDLHLFEEVSYDF